MLGATIPFAQEMLAKNGEFYPYGASLSIDGEVKMEASYTGDEQPESQALLDLLVARQAYASSVAQLRFQTGSLVQYTKTKDNVVFGNAEPYGFQFDTSP